MAEKLNIQPELDRNPEKSGDKENQASHERDAKNIERDSDTSTERMEASRAVVEQLAKSKEDLSKPDKVTERNKTQTPPPTKELQAMARDRILRTVRRKLSAPEKTLSSFMHSKPVETVSAVGEKTIARPYGLLGGGLCAFVGTLLTFYMAKHYGYRYNLFLFFTFFVAGYVITTVLELLVRAIRRK